MKAPCYNCEDRQIGCHAKCERYQSFSDARKAENAKRLHESRIDGESTAQKARQRSRSRAKKSGRMHWS